MPPESKIEADVCAFARNQGMDVYKFTSPSNRAVPDRIYLYKGHAMFIEFKRTGKTKLDPLQVVVRDRFLAIGFIVHLCNDVEEGKLMITNFKEGVDNVKPF